MPDDTSNRYPEEFFSEFKTKTRQLTTGKKTVGTTPIEICVDTTPLTNRIRLCFFAETNENFDPIYIGDSNVTTDTGYVVLPGKENEEVFEFLPEQTVDIYAVAENDVVIRIKEES